MKQSKTNYKILYAYILLISLVLIFVIFKAITNNEPVSYDSAKTYDISNNADMVGLCDKVDELYNSNAYIKVQVGEDDYKYLRVNKKSECYDNSGLVKLKGNEVISLNTEDNTVYTTNEGLNLEEVQCMMKLVDEGKATVEVTKEENIALYTIQLEGKDNIMEFYNLLSDYDYDFANIAYNVLLENIEDENSLFMNLVIGIDTENSENNGFSARYSFGDAESEYTVWIISGYIETPDWELDSDWYKDLTAEEFTELLDSLDKKTNVDLVLSNNDLFEGFDTNITWEEYSNSDTKNEIIKRVQEELQEVGILSTMDSVTLKKRLTAFYSDDTFIDIPLIKAAAYVISLEGQAVETEPETVTNYEITDEMAEEIVNAVGDGIE